MHSAVQLQHRRTAQVAGAAQPKISFSQVEKLNRGRRTGVGSTLALEHLSLDIADAEIVSIVDCTGCGKSTALNVLSGLEEPSSRSCNSTER